MQSEKGIRVRVVIKNVNIYDGVDEVWLAELRKSTRQDPIGKKGKTGNGSKSKTQWSL